MYRHSLLFALCITAFVLSPLGVAGTRTESSHGTSATLKKVTSRLDTKTGLLTIEASDPVPYVASQIDARTTVVELRDVVASGTTGNVKVDQRHPIDAVTVENGIGPDGTAVARVRITFHQPSRPRIRSSRNVIFVEADRVDASPALGAGGTAAGPTLDTTTFTPTIRDLRVVQRGTATAVMLRGTAPLVASGIRNPRTDRVVWY
jgi:hypothetical protein